MNLSPLTSNLPRWRVSTIILIIGLFFSLFFFVSVTASSSVNSSIGPFTPLAKIIYVDKDAPGAPNDGTSWDKAFKDLQSALADASSDDQIWVADGDYKPTGSTDRTATFQLKNGVAIYGGFVGTENDLNDRDWQANITILSGDIDNNDNVPFTDVNDIIGNNSYHVVTGSGNNQTAVLDGFTIRGGKADSGSTNPCDNICGGAIYNISGSPTFRNLIIGINEADWEGGGMYNYNGSNPSLTSVTFTGNHAVRGGGMANDASSPTLTDVTFTSNRGTQGGGLFNVDGSNSTLDNVEFESNHADNNGGGMFNNLSKPLLVDVTFHLNDSSNNGGGLYSEFGENLDYPILIGATFTGNSAVWGGGISNVECGMVLVNALFSGNTAIGGSTNPEEQGGGAIHNYSSNPTLTNVTIAGNKSFNDGGGIRNNNNSLPIIQNSIIWGNNAPLGPQVFNDVGSQSTILYSDVQGSGGSGGGWNPSIGTDGGHNIDADPKFVRPPSPGPDGKWDGVDDDYGDLSLQQVSPAINSGLTQLDPDPIASPPDSMLDIPTDIVGNPRTAGGLIDMGAYAFEGKAVVRLPVIFSKP